MLGTNYGVQPRGSNGLIFEGKRCRINELALCSGPGAPPGNHLGSPLDSALGNFKVLKLVVLAATKMIQRAAHALKGSVGTFQASAAHAAASQLEMFAKDADLVRARKAFERLSTQIDLVRQDLRQLAQAPAADGQELD